MSWTFRSRLALWVLRLVIGLSAAWGLAAVLVEIGDCHGGVMHPVHCERAMPDAIAETAPLIAAISEFTMVFAGAPLAVLAVVWEIVCRLRR